MIGQVLAGELVEYGKRVHLDIALTAVDAPRIGIEARGAMRAALDSWVERDGLLAVDLFRVAKEWVDPTDIAAHRAFTSKSTAAAIAHATSAQATTSSTRHSKCGLMGQAYFTTWTRSMRRPKSIAARQSGV